MSTDEKPREYIVVACEWGQPTLLTVEPQFNFESISGKFLLVEKSQLDSAHAAILHLRQASQRLISQRGWMIVSPSDDKYFDDLAHALSATSGYKEKK